MPPERYNMARRLWLVKASCVRLAAILYLDRSKDNTRETLLAQTQFDTFLAVRCMFGESSVQSM